MLVAQSCPTLCDTMAIHVILQARILEWVAIPFSRGASQPRDGTWASCIASRFFAAWDTVESPGKPLLYLATVHSVAQPGLLSFPSYLSICRATPSAPDAFNYRTSNYLCLQLFQISDQILVFPCHIGILWPLKKGTNSYSHSSQPNLHPVALKFDNRINSPEEFYKMPMPGSHAQKFQFNWLPGFF